MGDVTGGGRGRDRRCVDIRDSRCAHTRNRVAEWVAEVVETEGGGDGEAGTGDGGEKGE